MVSNGKAVCVPDNVFIVLSRHDGEEIHLAGLHFLDNPDGSFLVGEVFQGQLPGEAFAVAAQRIEESLKIVRRRRRTTSSVRRTYPCMDTATPPTTMNFTFASASTTNSFSNEGSIVGRRRPRTTPDHLGIASEHFQALEHRQPRETASHFFLQRFAEWIGQ